MRLNKFIVICITTIRLASALVVMLGNEKGDDYHNALQELLRQSGFSEEIMR